jgi:hypothetical protein
MELMVVGISLTTLYNSNTADNNPAFIISHAINPAQVTFTLNSQENVTSDYVFVRARNPVNLITHLRILHLYQVLQVKYLYNEFYKFSTNFYYYYRNV